MMMNYSDKVVIDNLLSTARKAQKTLNDWACGDQSIRNEINDLSTSMYAFEELLSLVNGYLSTIDELQSDLASSKDEYRSLDRIIEQQQKTLTDNNKEIKDLKELLCAIRDIVMQ
jgi:predicted  nucleic acid-binding Zn-ribbon protein